TTAVAGYDPSKEYHDYSTVQIWVGKNKAGVGDVIGPILYRTIWGLLNDYCPHNGDKCTLNNRDKWPCFKTHTLGVWPYPVEETSTCINEITAEYDNEQIRSLLIGAIAGTFEALTNQLLDDVSGVRTNCYKVGENKGCNVADVVRVINMRKHNDRQDFMYVGLSNFDTHYGPWDCCAGGKRELFDKAIDGLGGVFGQKFTRDSRCIINRWEACK
ncbi:hypothetical protein EK21DRAFT_26998, partial [Setomelanomma holmii]